MVDLKVTIPKNLERIRKEKDLTHSEMARVLGINRTTLYLYESGRRVLPTELVYKIWEVLGYTPNEVLLTEEQKSVDNG